LVACKIICRETLNGTQFKMVKEDVGAAGVVLNA
jgi:hypothetical protein